MLYPHKSMAHLTDQLLDNIKVIYPYVNLPTPDMDLVNEYIKMFRPPIVLGVGPLHQDKKLSYALQCSFRN